jgi:hypothetical protein
MRCIAHPKLLHLLYTYGLSVRVDQVMCRLCGSCNSMLSLNCTVLPLPSPGLITMIRPTHHWAPLSRCQAMTLWTMLGAWPWRRGCSAAFPVGQLPRQLLWWRRGPRTMGSWSSLYCHLSGSGTCHPCFSRPSGKRLKR